MIKGKYCALCGTEVNAEGELACNHTHKKMCVNCQHCTEDENGNLVCSNENNLKTVKEKMLEAAKAASTSYEIVDFNIKPLPLKKPTICCGNWVINTALIDEFVESFN